MLFTRKHFQNNIIILIQQTTFKFKFNKIVKSINLYICYWLISEKINLLPNQNCHNMLLKLKD